MSILAISPRSRRSTAPSFRSRPASDRTDAMIALFHAAMLTLQTTPPGEEPVAPYAQSDANAGATPFRGNRMWRAFHERPGVDRIVDELVDRNIRDPRIADIF